MSAFSKILRDFGHSEASLNLRVLGSIPRRLTSLRSLFSRRLQELRRVAHPKRMFDVTDGLIRRGYRDEDIKLILGGNAMRIWPKAATN